MSRHAIYFTNLIDWLDNRLSAAERQRVEAHLANCPTCQRDLAWLQRVIQAARSDDLVEPPPEAVARAKALFRARKVELVQRELRQVRRPRLAFALLLTVLLIASVIAYLSQTPTLLACEAKLAMVEGSVQVQRQGTEGWQSTDQGDVVREGDSLRVGDGAAVLTLFEGSQLEMQPGSELRFSTLRSGLFEATYHIMVQQTAGVVDYNVASLRSSLSRFEAYAPTVRVAVHGTRFIIAVQSQEQTQVMVLQGSVKVTNALTETILTEREVAIVPANAPLVYLPTLTPRFTPEPTLSKTPSPLAAVSPTVTATPPIHGQGGNHRTATPPLATAHPMPAHTPTPIAITSLTSTLTTGVYLTPTLPQRADRVPFQGIIERLPRNLMGLWTISGQDVLVTPRTQISGTPEVGCQVRGVALAIAGQPLVALQMEIEEPQPGETSLPSPTPGLGPHPVRTPWPTLTTEPGRWPSPVNTPLPAWTPLPIATLLPRRTPHWMPTPASTSLQPTAMPEATTVPPATELEATPTPESTIPPISGPRPRR